MIKEILQIQPTKENPVVVDNYPYGFKRTQIRYWVESVKKKGDRFCSQTLNPKTQIWNNPKKSTYNAVSVVYKNEKGYITYYGYNRSTDEESYNKFIDFIGDLKLNEIQKEELKILRAYIKTYKNVSYETRKKQFRHKVTGEIVNQVSLMDINNYEEIEDEGQEQEEIKTRLRKSVVFNYTHE